MTTIVDSHLHVWRALPAGVPGVPTIVSPHEDVPVERALEVLDRHGVSRGVLVQPMFRGEDNSYVADVAAERPDRLRAVCVVDPRTPGAEDRLEHWVVRRGCRGLRLRPRVPAESAVFGGPATFPLWERARSLGVVISVLTDPAHLNTIGALAARFPEVFVVIDHLAHPNVSEGKGAAGFRALLALARHPRIVVKISGYYYFTDQPDPYLACWDLVQAVYDHFGPERLIWGSDFPHVEWRAGYARSLELVRRDFPFLHESDREWITGGNALRLYWNANV